MERLRIGAEFRQRLDESDVMKSLQSRQFKVDLVGRHLVPEFPESAGLEALVVALAVSLAEGCNEPDKLGLDQRVWNPARVFNPARLKELRLETLTWDALDPRGVVSVRCSGIEQALLLPEEPIPRTFPLQLPSHPTLPAPWRVVEICKNGILKELAVVGRFDLAARPTREGIKAREIWFERFAEVVTPGLPDCLRCLRFDLQKGHPKNPLRTFAMSFAPDALIARPACPECGNLCDRLVHLDLRRHPQGLKLPGTSLLMFTCSEHDWDGSCWQCDWRQRDDARSLLPSYLDSGDTIFSGPAIFDIDYDDSRVDRDAFNRNAEQWPAFENWQDESRGNLMFAVPGTKVGGVASWIQGDSTPEDSDGKPMRFVGQFASFELIQIGDTGDAYVFHSPITGETTVVTQGY